MYVTFFFFSISHQANGKRVKSDDCKPFKLKSVSLNKVKSKCDTQIWKIFCFEFVRWDESGDVSPHRAPGSGSPLVRLAPGKVVPAAGIWWGRERSGLAGAGRALGHGAVLLRGGTIVGVALAGAHFLLAEVDADNLPRRLALAARDRALQRQHTQRPWPTEDSPHCMRASPSGVGVGTDHQNRQFELNSSVFSSWMMEREHAQLK